MWVFFMVLSDFIPVHQLTSANASLSHQVCALRIFVHVMQVAMQKADVGRRRPMQNDGSQNTPLVF